MGFIGRMLSFTRVLINGAKVSDVKMDIGGGEIITAQHSQGTGVDAVPLPADYPVAISIPRSGALIVVSWAETDATQKAEAGDYRIYSRKADRNEAAEVWLKADGTILADNENCSVELKPDGSVVITNSNGTGELRVDGTFDFNGATIDSTGNVVATSFTAPSMVVNGKELDAHDHAIVSGSSAPGPTGPNN